jgi:hypothetical protein
MANTNIPLPGYPTAYANKIYWRGDHVGQANYSTGGEFIPPLSFGMQGVEDIGSSFGGFSYSNNYYVKAWLPANSFSANEQFASSFGPNASNANVNNYPALIWYYANNNNQVAANANLSAEGVRLTVIGV